MKILYIEDDRINRVVLRKLLQPHADTDLAASGDEALRQARQNVYDVFLIDIHLGDPAMDGIKTMQMLRDMAPQKHATYIALTAYALKEDEKRFLSAGFDYHHPKPVNVDQLLYEMSSKAV